MREPADAQRRELVDFVRETTKEGTAILPCFALGRGQEVLEILLQAGRSGALDQSVTIWVDGLIRAINPYYIERMRLIPTGFQVVETGDRWMAIADCQRPDARAVIVTTSGMLNGGPVVEWADALLGDPRNRIALLGYQDEGSAGERLDGSSASRRVRRTSCGCHARRVESWSSNRWTGPRYSSLGSRGRERLGGVCEGDPLAPDGARAR